MNDNQCLWEYLALGCDVRGIICIRVRWIVVERSDLYNNVGMA